MLEERDIEFLRVFWSRRAVLTYVLFAANILIFILMELAGGATNEATLLAFGVKSNVEIQNGEIWRLITPIFIHIGLLHIFFNSYALWIVGPQVERLYGGARFFIIYICAGIAGVLGSYWYHPETFSAGASGAIFGLFGALFVFGLKYRSSIPPSFQRAVGKGVLPVIAINLFIGFTIPGIDNSAHIGGLLAGAALAAVIPYERPGTSTHPLFKFGQVVLVVLTVASFAEIGLHYDGPRIALGNVVRNWRGLLGTGDSGADFVGAINSTQQAFEDCLAQIASSDLAGLPAAGEKLGRAIDELNHISSVGAAGDRIVSELLALSQNEYALIGEIGPAKSLNFDQQLQASQNRRRYDALMGEFENWVDTNGKKYGIQIRKDP